MSRITGPAGLIALVCFFLPWITVSCNNVLILENIPAYELAQGITIQGQTSESEPLLYGVAGGAFLLMLGGFLIWRTKTGLGILLSLVGALATLAITFIFRQGVLEAIKQDPMAAGMISVRWEMGFWGVVGSSAAGLVGALWPSTRQSKRDLAQ